MAVIVAVATAVLRTTFKRSTTVVAVAVTGRFVGDAVAVTTCLFTEARGGVTGVVRGVARGISVRAAVARGALRLTDVRIGVGVGESEGEGEDESEGEGVALGVCGRLTNGI